MSPAKVEEWLHSDKGSPWKHRDDGGGISSTVGGIGGMPPTGNPMVQGMYQQYSSLPTERLQELNARLGGTPQGQIIRSVLQRRLSQPNAQPQPQMPTMGMIPPQQAARSGGMIHRIDGGAVLNRGIEPSSAEFDEILRRGWHDYMRANRTGNTNADPNMKARAPSAPDNMEISKGKYSGLGGRTDYDPDNQNVAHGGRVHRAVGGGSPMGVPMSMASPWWERQEAYGANKGASGFLAGSTAGRADQIKTTAPGGAYVLPADVVAGLGDGNSLAGARVMDEMLRSGPHGTPMERGVRGRGPPRPPSDPMLAREAGVAKGGGVQSGKGETPVALSHGEYVLTPEQVMALGGGDHKRGTRILDHFVVGVRKKHIDKLKKLPPPVGAKLK